MKAPGGSTGGGTLSRSDAPRKELDHARLEQDSRGAGARRVVRLAELVLERQKRERQGCPLGEWQRLRRASLYLAAARSKLGRRDWWAALLLASRALDMSPGVAGRRPPRHPDLLGSGQLARNSDRPPHIAETRVAGGTGRA